MIRHCPDLLLVGDDASESSPGASTRLVTSCGEQSRVRRNWVRSNVRQRRGSLGNLPGGEWLDKENAHVGTAAPGCPLERSSSGFAVLHGELSRYRERRAYKRCMRD